MITKEEKREIFKYAFRICADEKCNNRNILEVEQDINSLNNYLEWGIYNAITDTIIKNDYNKIKRRFDSILDDTLNRFSNFIGMDKNSNYYKLYDDIYEIKKEFLRMHRPDRSTSTRIIPKREYDPSLSKKENEFRDCLDVEQNGVKTLAEYHSINKACIENQSEIYFQFFEIICSFIGKKIPE